MFHTQVSMETSRVDVFGDNRGEENRTHKLPTKTFYKQHHNKFDENGRMQEHYCDISENTITNNTLIHQMSYDFEDQLTQTKIGSNLSSPIQTIDYTYNTQGC